MKQIYKLMMLAALSFCGYAAMSQSVHTVYFNGDGEEVEPSKALFKEVTQEDASGEGISTRYRLKDNVKLRETRYTRNAQGKKLQHGTHTEWYDSGQPKIEKHLRNDSLTGPHTRWYESGQVHIRRHHHRYQLVDTLRSYYESGALRRLEVYSKGEMQTGKVYNEAGDEIQYTPMEVMPEYPGGEDRMMSWLIKNVRYPAKAQKARVQGFVVVSYLVDTAGQISNIEVLRSVHPDIDAEAIRVVKLMPKFKPGTIEGKPTDMPFVLPIRFAIH